MAGHRVVGARSETAMNFSERSRWVVATGFALGATTYAIADGFVQTNLVSNRSGVAQVTDPGLVNAWGLAYSATGPFWVANNGTGTATVYNVAALDDSTSKSSLTVAIPGDGSVTGQVFNAGTGFNGDRFLFVNEDGTISGWRSALGSSAETLATGLPSNVYKGAAVSTIGGHDYLYAANFRSGSVDVLKGDFGAANLTGNFTDPNLPASFAPFNIQNLGGTLYVTYGKQDANGFDALTGAGLGIVDAFDLQGNLIGRIASQGTLNAPWGLAIAPGSFGAFAGDLLVGNFGDGRINAFDPVTHALVGQLKDGNGGVISIDGLWGLTPGNGDNGGSIDRVYFSAGPNGEADGLFGSLAMVPEPGTVTVLLFGLGSVGLRRRKR